MKALKRNKKRFRNNLQQFIELKEAGKLNGSAAQIKEKLKAAAGALDLDFLKEYKKVYKDVTRENCGSCKTRNNPASTESQFLTGLECLDPSDFRKNPAVKPDEIYQMITDMVINTIKKKGHLPWQKEWDDSGLSGGKTATNFVSGNAYRGINFFMLNFRQVENEDGELTIEMIDFDNPYFLTFNQVEDLGGKVKKDSHGQKVIYFTKLYKIEQDDPEIDFGTYSLEEMIEFVKQNYDDIKRTGGRTPEQVARSNYLPILKYYNVFHASDIEGIDWGTLPKNENAEKPKEFKIKVAKAIYENYPNAPEVKHVEPRAYYKPDMDFINMPPLERFDEEQYYHTTLFHEATHSTGHDSRLNRDLKGGQTSKNKYAFEELIAEMGAVFLCAESGILFRTIDNSASYLQSWNKRLVKKMKDDNRFFFRAASRAQAAADYILDRNDEGIPAYRNDVKVETEEREPVRTNPETDTVCVDDITCEVTVQAKTNAAKGGIEIRFSDTPPEDIREQLKDHDFWFYTPKDGDPYWAGEITTENKELAESIAGKFDSAVLKGKKKNDNGRGEEKPQGSQNANLEYELGAETTVDFKADGSIQYTGDYAIVDLATLQASHNKDCSVNSKHEISRSQPRDRSKEALCAQPKFIAKNLNPASITQGNLAFNGAPVVTIIGQWVHVIQGNGRTISLKIAYDEMPKNAEKYRKYLLDHAADFGLTKKQINHFEQPVLVRMVPVDKEKAIGLGNVVDTSQAKMSKIDQAKAYIRNLSELQLQIIGEFIKESSGETIGAIIDDIGMDIIKQLKQLDRTGIVENNKLTSEGKDFLRSVLVGLVFDSEEHPNALHHYMNLPHTIKAGLERSFGYIIPLIDNKGDIRKTLSRAVEVAAQTYQNEAIDTANEYAASKDMFEEKDFSKDEIALAQFLLDADTQKFIRNGFRYYDELLKGKENLFGKVPAKSKKQAFKLAFVDRARPNPKSDLEEVIHKTIVRAQRLENFGHDNSEELERLDNLLGKDGWKWNDKRTQIIRLDNEEDRFNRLVILEQFRQEKGRNAEFEQFEKWLKEEYPKQAGNAKEIWETVPYGAWRSNPAALTADVKRSVLDDFYAWIEGNPLMDYTPGPITFKTWIQYHYPGYEDAHDEIWDMARPAMRENPTAKFVYIGICDRILIDQGKPEPVTLQGPLAMMTNKSMNKLFIVPIGMLDSFSGKVEDMKADEVYEQWHNFAPDNSNYLFNWPSYKESHPVGTAKEIYYISDKVMREHDSKGDMNMYHHEFDPGKRPAAKKGNILIVSDLDISERGILN